MCMLLLWESLSTHSLLICSPSSGPESVLRPGRFAKSVTMILRTIEVSRMHYFLIICVIIFDTFINFLGLIANLCFY